MASIKIVTGSKQNRSEGLSTAKGKSQNYLRRPTLLIAMRSSLHLNNVSYMEAFTAGQVYKHFQDNFQQGYGRNKFARAGKMNLSSLDQYMQVKVFEFSL